MSWQKEKHEHPWATKKQAKQIARDHNNQKQSRQPIKHNYESPAIQTAHRDFTGLYGGAKRIAYQRKP
jgi:hypothetical protein